MDPPTSKLHVGTRFNNSWARVVKTSLLSRIQAKGDRRRTPTMHSRGGDPDGYVAGVDSIQYVPWEGRTIRRTLVP